MIQKIPSNQSRAVKWCISVFEYLENTYFKTITTKTKHLVSVTKLPSLQLQMICIQCTIRSEVLIKNISCLCYLSSAHALICLLLRDFETQRKQYICQHTNNYVQLTRIIQLSSYTIMLHTCVILTPQT